MKRTVLSLFFILFPFFLFASAEIDLFTALLNLDWRGAERILDRYPRLLDKRGKRSLTLPWVTGKLIPWDGRP